MDHITEIIEKFALDSPAVSYEMHGTGHIHATYQVITESGKQYILQKINEVTFRNVPELMENIVGITEYLKDNAEDPESPDLLRVIPLKTGESWTREEDGAYRMFNFIGNSLSLDMPESPADFYESAVGIGRFQQNLAGYPVEKLHEAIPHFHDTPDRFRIFKEVLATDPMGRAAIVKPEIDFYLAREEELGTLQRMREEGILPTRVTHNDTKLNNVLLDARTRKAKCVIDLDTVMPGLSLYDYGDSIRFGASTAAEDEHDLSLVSMDMTMFRTYTEGFISACPSLTEAEIRMLPLGIKTMTAECGLRFLTDYLDGDHYFTIHYEDQNLRRSRTQIRLVEDMEGKWEEMQKTVLSIAGLE